MNKLKMDRQSIPWRTTLLQWVKAERKRRGKEKKSPRYASWKKHNGSSINKHSRYRLIPSRRETQFMILAAEIGFSKNLYVFISTPRLTCFWHRAASGGKVKKQLRHTGTLFQLTHGMGIITFHFHGTNIHLIKQFTLGCFKIWKN